MLGDRCTVAAQKLDALNKERDALDQSVKTSRGEILRGRAAVDEFRKKLKAHNDQVRVLLSLRCGILRDCQERYIEVPLRGPGGPALEQVLSRERDIDEFTIEMLDAACRAGAADFTALPEPRMEQADQTRVFDTKGVEAEYEDQLAAIDKDLEGINPNMRALEQHEVEEGRLKAVLQQEREVSGEERQLARAFEDVKAERIARFMECFKHVESRVQPYYNHLTSFSGCEGGSAYLDLDDAEEPYNGGITFTACPPGKRFFPMDLLSGGEKSMASMALLFAMHSYRPPPFMILDEVDAPFDRKNTDSLVSYLQTLEFQCLVISLKDTFFSHSDSIVGIYKDKELQTSGSLSLPLRRLGGEDSQEPETEVPRPERPLEI